LHHGLLTELRNASTLDKNDRIPAILLITEKRMTTRAGWISRLTVSTVLSFAALGANAQQTIKIGEINSYKAQPAFLGPYKNGWNLALEQVNAAGGVLGKPLEVVSRDDNGNPGDTIRVAQELIAREQVQLLSRAD
jgi:branched-chain amino acid transport system substrate-binding protein